MLVVDANERSITHKFAECLMPLFDEDGDRWDVDCEYNRDGHNPKRIELDTEMVRSDDDQGRTVFPDIIVHNREKPGEDNNLLIIEAKKDPNDMSREEDWIKIQAIMRSLEYRFGVFLIFITGENPDIEYEFVHI